MILNGVGDVRQTWIPVPTSCAMDVTPVSHKKPPHIERLFSSPSVFCVPWHLISHSPMCQPLSDRRCPPTPMTGHLPLEETATQLYMPLATSHFLQKQNKSILVTTHDCKMHLTQSVQTRKRLIPAKQMKTYFKTVSWCVQIRGNQMRHLTSTFAWAPALHNTPPPTHR